MRQGGAQVMAEPFELFALECVKAHGVDLQSVGVEKRRIIHGLQVRFHRCLHHLDARSVRETSWRRRLVRPQGSKNIKRDDLQGPLSVGRAFQTLLFEVLMSDRCPKCRQELVAKSVGRSSISREHFQARKSSQPWCSMVLCWPVGLGGWHPRLERRARVIRGLDSK